MQGEVDQINYHQAGVIPRGIVLRQKVVVHGQGRGPVPSPLEGLAEGIAGGGRLARTELDVGQEEVGVRGGTIGLVLFEIQAIQVLRAFKREIAEVQRDRLIGLSVNPLGCGHGLTLGPRIQGGGLERG